MPRALVVLWLFFGHAFATLCGLVLAIAPECSCFGYNFAILLLLFFIKSSIARLVRALASLIFLAFIACMSSGQCIVLLDLLSCSLVHFELKV